MVLAAVISRTAVAPAGTLPGPSRTIIVEPVRQPVQHPPPRAPLPRPLPAPPPQRPAAPVPTR
jgi:hypothetical protein